MNYVVTLRNPSPAGSCVAKGDIVSARSIAEFGRWDSDRAIAFSNRQARWNSSAGPARSRVAVDRVNGVGRESSRFGC
jgi:hypothetical protein